MEDVRAELGFCRAYTKEIVIDNLARCLANPESRASVLAVLWHLHDWELSLLAVVLAKFENQPTYAYGTLLSEIIKFNDDAKFRSALHDSCGIEGATYGMVLVWQLGQYIESDWIIGLA